MLVWVMYGLFYRWALRRIYIQYALRVREHYER